MRIVHAVVRNRQVYIGASAKTERELSEFWSFSAKGARWVPSHKLWLRFRQKAIDSGESLDNLPGWDGKIRFLKRGSVPEGLFRATRQEIRQKLGIRFRIELKDNPARHIVIDEVTKQKVEKYHYQEECIGEMQSALRTGGGLVLIATSGGKTAITGRFFRSIDCKCLFVVDTLDLLYQAQEELQKWSKEKVGIVGNSVWIPERITVATRQTLNANYVKHQSRFETWLRNIPVVVVDELHEQMSKRNFAILDLMQPAARYGLTATLQLPRKEIRLKAYAFAGPVLYRFSVAEGTERKVLSAAKAVQLLFPQEHDWETPDYQSEYQMEVVQNVTKLNAIRRIVTHLTGKGRYCMVMGWAKTHVKGISGALDEPHRIVMGEVSSDDRKIAQKRLEAGKIRVLVASGVYKKGVNLKRVDAMADMAEMKSKNDAAQKFGRGLRLHPDKDGLLYIDIATETGRFRKAANSRASSIRSLGIDVKVHKVRNSREALAVIKQYV